MVWGVGGRGGPLLDSPVSQKSGKVPLPQPVWEPPLASLLLTPTPSLQHPDNLGGEARQPLQPGSKWGSRTGVPFLPPIP